MALVCILFFAFVVTTSCGGGGLVPNQPFQGSSSGGGNPTGIIGATPPTPKGSVNPTSINLGDVGVGQTFSQAVLLTNSGNADLQVRQVSLTGSSSITITGLALPLTLTPGQSIPFSVQFAPQATGTASATVSFSSNAATPINSLSLSGNGVASAASQLSANPVALDFGSVVVGSPGTQTITLTNTGGISVIVSGITATGTGFSLIAAPALPLTLTPGQSQAMSVQFAPTAAGAATGSITVTSDASNSPNTVALAGNGVASTLTLNVSPNSIDFGTVTIGQNAVQTVTMTNTGNSSITVTAANVTGTGYSITPALSLPRTLTPGQSQSFTIRFAPTGSGTVTGSVALVSNASNSPTAVSLTGSGLAQLLQLSANPSNVGFGDVVLGSTATQAVTITNTGNANITISAATATGTGFSLTGLTTPVTLNPGQATSFTARFAPTATGNVPGSISLASNATSSPTVIGLSGNGVPVPVLALVANPSSLNFGDVLVASADIRSVTLTNTGNTSITVNTATVAGAGFSIAGLALPVTLAAGQNVSFSTQFAPGAAGAVSGSVSIASTATNSPAVIALSGNGVAPAAVLQATPASITFGSVIVGNSQNQLVTVTNTGNASGTISAANVSGSGFSISGLATPQTLAPAQSLSFTATFAPSSGGNAAGNISLVGSAANSPTNIGLGGTGVAQVLTLSANPSSIGFGDVVVGSNSTQTITVTNTGNVSVTINSSSVTGAGFSLLGLALPQAVPAGQSISFSAQFAPSATGNVSGNISLSSTATSSPTLISLTGNGVNAPVPGFLSPNPSAFDFGNVVVGNTGSHTFTLTNTGSSTVNVTAVAVPGAGFSTTGLPPSFTLLAGQSTTFTASFAPAAPGAAAGTITLTSDATNSPTTITLAGTGVAAVLQMSVSPSTIDFGSIIVGNNTSQTVVMTNAGNSNLTVTAANVTGAGFSIVPALSLPLTLTPGQGQSFTVRFAPLAAGAASGSVSLVSNASNSPTAVTLTGTGVAQVLTLSLNPTSIGFGDVLLGVTDTRSVTVTNTGNSGVTITSASATGAGFSFTGLTLPLTLAAGQSSTFNARFAPAAAGNVSGNISLVSNASNSPTLLLLSGNGVAVVNTLTANPTSLNFGNVFTGVTDVRTVTLTNSGNVNITVNTATPAGAGFSITGLTLPLTLTPGQSTSFSARFAPVSAGAVSGSISITSSASNSPTVVSLSGTGVTPVATLSASPSNIAFGNLFTGSAQSQTVTITNTGNVNVSLSASSVTGAGFSISGLTVPQTLTPGQAVSFSVQFAPASAGAVTGSVSITSTASNSPTTVTLSGTGVTPTTLLSASPTNINFGNVFVGSNSTQLVTLTNTGNTNVTVTAATPAGAGFSITGLVLPLTLTPGQTATFTVQFAPAAAGSVTGSVSVVSNATNSPATVSLSGAGVAASPQITVNPSSLDFGGVVVGSSFSQNILITNTGNLVLTISAATVSGVGYSTTGLTMPLTLNPGQSSNFAVVFTPAAASASSGSIVLTSNAPTSPTTVSLTGTGTTGITLVWDPTTTVPIAGYRVYRSAQSGTGYILMNASLITGTTFVDSTVAPGQTYFYVATAVDSAGVESIFSNEITVVVP